MNIKKAEDICIALNNGRSLKYHTGKPIYGIVEGKKARITSYARMTEGLAFMVNDQKFYSYKDILLYDPMYDGAVTAIRIYLKDGHQPMADLAFAFGGTYTFEWDRCDIREMFEPGINAYTLMYDTRCIRPFTDWIKPKEGE